MILLCFSYSLVDGRQPSPGPCDPSSGPFLVRMNRPTTDGIGRMSSVLYFLRSESEQPLPAMRVGKRTTMPVGSRTGHRQNEPVRTRCDVPRSPTISIATQQRTNETNRPCRMDLFYKNILFYFYKNIINYQTFNRFTSRSPRTRRNPGVFSSPCRATGHTIDRHSPRTREMRPVLPFRAGFASSLQPVFPSFHAHRDRLRPNQDSDRAGRIPMKFLSYGHVLSGLRRTCRGNNHRETAEREIRT